MAALQDLPRRDLLAANLAVEASFVDADTAAALIRDRMLAVGAPEEGLIDVLEREVDLGPADRLRLEAQVERALGTGRGEEAIITSRPLRDAIRTQLSMPLSSASTASGRRPALRTMVEGRYRHFLPLSEGGMGIVYLALDAELNREVAIKLIRPLDGGDGITEALGAPQLSTESAATDCAATEARFLQEAWVTGILEHPGIAPVYEVGRTPAGVPYYTMRFVRGSRTLRDALDGAGSCGAVDPLTLVEPWLKVCDAIGYAHARHILHRDLKPENVALGDFGEVVVLDWGLARVSGAAAEDDARFHEGLAELREGAELATMAQALGTPGYMAPEAALGNVRAISPASDVYSLGVMLFEILAGRRPFEFRTFLEYAEQVAQHEAPALRVIEPGLPAGLAALCDRALAREPGERFEDASALADAVRAWQIHSERGRIVEGHRIAAETALTEAAALRGSARLRALESVVAAGARIEEAAGSKDSAEELLARARTLRREGLTEAARDARRRTLRRVASIAAVVLVSLGAIVALVLDSKNEDLQASRDLAEARGRVASEERDRAEGVVDFLIADVRVGLEEIGRLDLLTDVAEQVMAHYEARLAGGGGRLTSEERLSYARAIGGLAEVLEDQGRSAEALRAIDKAMELLRASKARADRHLRARLRVQRGFVRENRKEDVGARAHYAAAVGELRELWIEGATDPRVGIALGVALRRLANMEIKRGDLDRAHAGLVESRRVLDGIDATSLSDVEKAHWLRERAERLHREAEVARQRMQRNVDHACLKEASELWEQAYRLRPQDRHIATGLARSLTGLGGVNYEAGRFEKTVELNRRARPITERLLGLAPDSMVARQFASGIMLNEAWALIALGRLGEAIEVLQRCLGIEEELARLDKASDASVARLARLHVALGRTYARAGKTELAIPLLIQAMDAADLRLSQSPSDIGLRGGAAFMRKDLAAALERGGEPERARVLLSGAETLLAEVLKKQPENARRVGDQIAVLVAGAALDVQAGRFEPALAAARRAGEAARKRNAAAEDATWLLMLAEARHVEGTALWHLQGAEQAYPVLEEARRLFRSGLAARPGARVERTSFAETLIAEARMRREDGARVVSAQLLDEAVALLRQCAHEAPEERPTVRAFRAAQAALADVHESLLHLDDAVAPRRELARILRVEAEQSPWDAEAQIAAADAALDCGVLLLDAGPLGEALVHLERARLGYEEAISRSKDPGPLQGGLGATLEALVRGLAAASRSDEARGMLPRRLALPDAAAAGGAHVRARIVAWREAIQALAEKRTVEGTMATRFVARVLRSRGAPREALNTHRALPALPPGSGAAVDLRLAARLAAALAVDVGASKEAREAALEQGIEFVNAELALRRASLARLDSPLAQSGGRTDRRAFAAARAIGAAWIEDLRAGDAKLAPLRANARFQALFTR